MQNFPYNTNWKDGKPINETIKNTNDKGTPKPLQRNIVNVVEDVPWCMACQSPHSPRHCVVAQFIDASQEVEKEENLEERNTNDTTCNMIRPGYEYENDIDCGETK